MTRRLLLSYLSLTVLVLLGLEVPFGIIYAQGELARFTDSLERDASALARLTELTPGGTAELPALGADYARRTGSRVTVVDRRGVVLSDSDPAVPAGSGLSTSPGIASALRNQISVGRSRDQAAGGDVFFAAVPTSGLASGGALRITSSDAEVQGRISRMWLVLAVVGITAMAAVTLIGFSLARWIVRPVRSLERVTDQLISGRLAEPPARSGPPELRRLAAALTGTAAKLRQQASAQRSFANDASRQLKTPLTALRLRLENLDSALDRQARPQLEAAIGEVDRLGAVVERLLRIEPATAEPEPVDLEAVLADRVERWASLADEQGVRVVVRGEPAGAVLAIPGALEQIIDNLIASALRVAPPDSTVTVARTTVVRPGREGGRLVELHVIDEGPAPAKREAGRPQGGTRSSRSGSTSQDGSALGLTVVRQLARASGGDIMLRPARGGGLDATVHLEPAPLAPLPPGLPAGPPRASRRPPVADPPSLRRARAVSPPTSAPAPSVPPQASMPAVPDQQPPESSSATGRRYQPVPPPESSSATGRRHRPVPPPESSSATGRRYQPVPPPESSSATGRRHKPVLPPESSSATGRRHRPVPPPAPDEPDPPVERSDARPLPEFRPPEPEPDDDDDEGWVVVQPSRRNRRRASTS